MKEIFGDNKIMSWLSEVMNTRNLCGLKGQRAHDSGQDSGYVFVTPSECFVAGS